MKRIESLDVLRGVALSGILVVNAPAVLHMGSGIDHGRVPVAYSLVEQLFHQRFFPIFSLLFGIGFGLMWAGAQGRAASPRTVLLRRLLMLGLIGALHQVLQPGEALLPYAVFGLLVLVPATFLPTRVAPVITGVLGAVLTGVAAPVGGLALIPGLFLLGFAAAGADLPRRLQGSPRVVAAATIGCGVLALPAAVVQQRDPADAGYSVAGSVAGLLVAGVYVGAVLLALNTSWGRWLGSFFAPLGRTSLTNYLSATVILTLLKVLGWPIRSGSDDPANWPLLFALCTVVLLLQRAASGWWLKRFGQGPMERIWRAATWGGLRLRDTTAGPGSPVGPTAKRGAEIDLTDGLVE